jgi:hypothetical protein
MRRCSRQLQVGRAGSGIAVVPSPVHDDTMTTFYTATAGTGTKGERERERERERMMGLEPTTFCMASRRSSQLSYIRVGAQYSRGRTGFPAARERSRTAGPLSIVVVALGADEVSRTHVGRDLRPERDAVFAREAEVEAGVDGTSSSTGWRHIQRARPGVLNVSGPTSLRSTTGRANVDSRRRSSKRWTRARPLQSSASRAATSSNTRQPLPGHSCASIWSRTSARGCRPGS